MKKLRTYNKQGFWIQKGNPIAANLALNLPPVDMYALVFPDTNALIFKLHSN